MYISLHVAQQIHCKHHRRCPIRPSPFHFLLQGGQDQSSSFLHHKMVKEGHSSHCVSCNMPSILSHQNQDARVYALSKISGRQEELPLDTHQPGMPRNENPIAMDSD